jgi:hypothetical protein
LIKYMIIDVTFPDAPHVELTGISNIQTAEAERSMYLEDFDDVDPLNVHVIQYKE